MKRGGGRGKCFLSLFNFLHFFSFKTSFPFLFSSIIKKKRKKGKRKMKRKRRERDELYCQSEHSDRTRSLFFRIGVVLLILSFLLLLLLVLKCLHVFLQYAIIAENLCPDCYEFYADIFDKTN